VSWEWAKAPMPKPKRFRPPPQPPRLRSFNDGDLVRLRERPELVGQVIIPARGGLPPRPTRLPFGLCHPRVKVIWATSAGPREWIDEDKLMAIDAITELGRLW